MIQPGQEALASALVARFLRRLAAAAPTTGTGIRRHKGDDPWPGRLFDPLQPLIPADGDAHDPDPPIVEPHNPDGPIDPNDPDAPDDGPDVEPHNPDGPANPEDPDAPDGPDVEPWNPDGQVHVVKVVEEIRDDADIAAAAFGDLSRSVVVQEHPVDDLQPMTTVGTIADDWTVLRGTFTAPGNTLMVTANATGAPLACALWRRWDQYTDVQAGFTLLNITHAYGIWLCAADDGTGKVNGYSVIRAATGALQVHRFVSNVGTLLATTGAPGLLVGERIIGVRRGSKIAIVAVNAGLVASATDTTYSRGMIGFGGGPALSQTVGGVYSSIAVGQAVAA